MIQALKKSGSEESAAAALSPRAEYVQRLEARRTEVARQVEVHQHIANARLAVFMAGVIIAGLALWAEQISSAWVAFPVVLFVVLMIWHGRLTNARRRAERAAIFYERGLARLDNQGMGKGERGARFFDERHPNALDLALLCRGAL